MPSRFNYETNEDYNEYFRQYRERHNEHLKQYWRNYYKRKKEELKQKEILTNNVDIVHCE